MLTNTSRVIKFALNDFLRNKGIAIASIFVLFAIIMLSTTLFFFQGIADYLVLEVQKKIDITAYFKEDTAEQDILDTKDQILKLSPDVKNIEYISKEQALLIFSENHKESEVFAKAIQEVGGNPFLPSLNIRTTGKPNEYEKVSEILATADFSKYIERVDFSEKKDTIEKVYSIISNVYRFGFILGIILIIIAMMIVFNTVKLTVDSSKEEINVMRTVGSPDWFIKGPFIIQGVIYGIIAFLISLSVVIVLAYIFNSKLEIVMPGFSITQYLWANFIVWTLVQLGLGIGLGAVSSFVAVKKYLKV